MSTLRQWPAGLFFGLGSLDVATETDNRSKNWERIPCFAVPPYCSSFGPDHFDILVRSPDSLVCARLDLVAAERERHIVCKLGQSDLAELHGNASVAAN